MDMVSPIISIVSRVMNYSTKHVNYLCALEEKLDQLKVKMEQLIEIKTDVNDKVIAAEEQLMVRTSQVNGWMQRVDAKGCEVRKILLEGTQHLERRCLNGCCPKNCWSSYKLGKKVVKELLDIQEMKRNGVFNIVAENPPRVPVQELPENFTIGLDFVFKEALNLLQVDDVGVLGLYGVGGVGKTTLLKKINNELLKRNNSFDIIIWVDISSNINIETIQEVIRERLGLRSRQGSTVRHQAASDIHNALQRKKFLILLDDVWEEIDLQSIGIPRPSAQNKSKIVLTTRSLDVCGSMGARHKIEVNCLNKDQSWNLFKEKVGPETLATDPQISNLAKKVAEKCYGLPLALITVGATMASKTNSREWESAISDLNKCAAKFPSMEKHVLPLLKFSYDRLPSQTQVCFLFCALYPEDYQIPIDSLIEQWIGLGYICDFENYEEALNKGHSIIGTLTRSCLLENVVVDENVGVDEKVKMHDVIRELALWIARECGREDGKVFVKSGHTFSKIPMNDLHPAVVETISLIDTRIDQLESLHNCPNLLTFFAPINYDLRHIYDDFFHFMPALKFLDLSSSFIAKIPTSICELVELEFLDLTHTNIKSLPSEMRNLTKLKYLSVSGRNDHGISTEIPRGMIKNFSNLEILKLEDRKTVDIDELGSLNKLKALDINLSDFIDIKKFVGNLRLCNSARRLIIEKCNEFTFRTPSRDLCFRYLRQLRRLAIRHCSEIEELIFTNESEIGLFESLETMFLDTLPKLIISMEARNLNSGAHFRKLHFVYIDRCDSMVNLVWLLLIPRLQTLWIDSCNSLQEILSSSSSSDDKSGGAYDQNTIFSNLKFLKFYNLPNLRSICSMSALPFPLLESMDVRRCPKLRKLPLDSNSASNTLRQIEGNKMWWNDLQWDNEAIKTHFTQKFRDTYRE